MVRTRGGRSSFTAGESSRQGAFRHTVAEELTPGPDDTSVLRLQHEHRSEAIWEGLDTGPIRFRQHRLWDLDPRVREYVRQAGFYGITQIGHIRIDTGLLTALIERWRCETHTFHFRVGEMTPTLQDVALLMGLRVHGAAVTGYGNYDWDQVCFQLLGDAPEEGDRCGTTLQLSWLRERFGLPPPVDATELVLSHYARGYILYMMGSTLFTATTGDSVSLLYLPHLHNLHLAEGYSWGGAMLACLYRNLCRTCTRGVRQMGGCVLFLQLWSWERLHVARPTIIPRAQDQEDIQPRPIGARWTTVRTFQHNPNHVLNFCRDELDQQKHNQVVWEPYTTTLLEDTPMIFLIGQHIWRAHVPLIFFEIVEIHCPDRVMRQFGLGQHIPDPIDTDDRLHQLSRRGRGEENWNVVNSDFIQLWEGREHFIVQERLPLPSSDDYMHWYLSITRRYITPRPTRLQTRRLDYQPHGSTLHRLIDSCERMARSAAIAVRDSVNDAARTVANNWLCSCRNALEDVGHGDRYHAAIRDVTMDDPSSSSNVHAPAHQQSRRRSTDRLL